MADRARRERWIETKGVVVVGVTEVNDALVQPFHATYGPLVRLETEGPGILF